MENETTQLGHVGTIELEKIIMYLYIYINQYKGMGLVPNKLLGGMILQAASGASTKLGQTFVFRCHDWPSHSGHCSGSQM